MFWEADKDMHADSISLQVLKKCIVCQPAPVWHMCVFSGFYLKMICEFSYRNVQLPLYTLVLGRFLSSKFREKKNCNFIYPKEIHCGFRLEKNFPHKDIWTGCPQKLQILEVLKTRLNKALNNLVCSQSWSCFEH